MRSDGRSSILASSLLFTCSGGASVSNNSSHSLEGTVAAITGASAGIGTATARMLAAAGVRVAMGARRKDRLDSLVGELGDVQAVAVPGDVRDPQSTTRFL